MNVRGGLESLHVLVTGGLGFIGSNLALRCAAEGARVTVYDNECHDSGSNPANLAGAPDTVRVVRGDILSDDDLARVVQGQNLVFHCAALTSHSLSMRSPERNLEVNCMGTIRVLEALRRHAPEGKLVHVGTATQMGRMVQEPAHEGHPERPLDFYSSSKSAAEKYVLAYSGALGLRATAVRLANVFGPRACVRKVDLGFLNYFIGLGLLDGEIRVFGDGSQRRNVLHVDDAVDALVRAALDERSEGDAFLATSDDHRTVLDVARNITTIVGGTLAQVEWPRERRDIEVGDTVYSNGKIKALLGWTPSVSFTVGLEATARFYRDRLQHYV